MLDFAIRAGLTVCVLKSELRSSGSSPGRLIVLYYKARHFTLHHASLHPGVWMGISKFSRSPDGGLGKGGKGGL